MIPDTANYLVTLPPELAVKVQELARKQSMTQLAFLTEVVKVGLIAAKVHSEGGRVLLERDGATTVLEWER